MGPSPMTFTLQRDRSVRLGLFGLTVVIVAISVAIGLLTLQSAVLAGRVGADLELYIDATRDALAGGGFYLDRQLNGPYPVTDGDILYPPTIIILFLPYLVVPAPLFWIVPLSVVGGVVAYHRPRAWTWPLLALAVASPITSLKVVHGNPVMWIVAAIALGTVVAWPAALVLLKPSLGPFAAIGIRRRSWWLALAALIVLSVPFGRLWLDYVRVVLDSRNPAGALYSLDEVPFALMPVIAWLGSSRTAPDLPWRRRDRPR